MPFLVKQLVDKILIFIYPIAMNDFIERTIKENGLTKADVARRMGVTPQAVHSMIETAEVRPSTLAKFLLALDWNMADIEALSLGEIYDLVEVASG